MQMMAQGYKQKGGIISHNLQDIFAVADRIVVMRRGHKVGDVPASEVTDDDLVAMMVGST